ncbi:MAG: undecaprenyl-diphosphatase [Bacillota bacterium]|nr:undecaprenyl-diphosphatase [Bacillota bacterium]
MNMEIFHIINNLAYKNKVLDSVMLFFSKDMIYIFAGIIAVLFLFGVAKRDKEARLTAVNTVVFTAISLIIAYFIGMVFYIDRPFVNNKVNLLYPHAADASFPSDHATVTMSTALGSNSYKRTFGNILIILSVIVGFSRVFVGHHTPFDIIGTYVLVFVISYAYNAILRKRISKVYYKVEGTVARKLGITWLYE